MSSINKGLRLTSPVIEPRVAQEYPGEVIFLMSPYRASLNAEIRKMLDTFFSTHPLLSELYYHFGFDGNCQIEDNRMCSKRLRGLLCMLISHGSGQDLTRTVPVACAVELYHNASLILDDIQDNSEQRLGRPALWRRAGVANAISAACLLMKGAELELVRLSSVDQYYSAALQELLAAAVLAVEGQTRDLRAQSHWEEGMAYYTQTARLKTGTLLGLACALGALSRLSFSQTELLRNYGMWLGLAHQVEDDIEDLAAFQNGTIKRVDPGNVAYFLVSALNLPKNNIESGLIHLIRSNAQFWTDIQTTREYLQRRVSDSFLALEGIHRDNCTELYEISRILCHRNDLTMREILGKVCTKSN